MGLISELQRRNVFRVAIAYLAGAWLVLQVAETLLPAYGFDAGAIRTVIALLGIGLVGAIVFAWVFELTPEGLRRETEVDRSLSITHRTAKKLDRLIILVLTLALIYFAFDKFVLTDIRIESARQEGRAEAVIGRHGNKSIAVLPFVDMSARGDQEYMSA
jgi:adenylate cyclase